MMDVIVCDFPTLSSTILARLNGLATVVASKDAVHSFISSSSMSESPSLVRWASSESFKRLFLNSLLTS